MTVAVVHRDKILSRIYFRHVVNSIPELELTLNSSSGIGIDFKMFLIFFFSEIYFLGIGIDFDGIIDLILLIFTLIFTYITFKIIFVCY